jgi:NitT/TauT family transport system ATP-binding protein
VATIKVERLHKRFGTGPDAVTALQNVDLEVSGHTFVSVVGPSGCGKSTLLNILSNIEVPTSGRVSITEGDKPARVGYVFQSARLLPWRSVIDNLMLVQHDRGAEARARCEKFLDMVHLLHRANDYPGQLSGGMQQRVGIARAFSIEPDVLLMDEPFSHLDAITARTLRRDLHELWKETRKTVMFVTHDVGEAVELSNRIVVFAQGGVLREDIPIDLPFPRDAADEAVAVTKASVLRKFEELDLVSS